MCVCVCSNEKETRDTFKFMKTERIGERDPLFYEEYAAFECRHGGLWLLLLLCGGVVVWYSDSQIL